MTIIIDGRGKKMVSGGRFRVAQQARFLRSCSARWRDGNAAARHYIKSAADSYVYDCETYGWTTGQRLHNRLVGGPPATP